MASTARSLSRAAHSLSRAARLRKNISLIGPISSGSRSFSASSVELFPEDPVPERLKKLRPQDLPPIPQYSPDTLSKEDRSVYESMSMEDRAQFDAYSRQLVEDFNNEQERASTFEEIDRVVNQIEKDVPMRFEDVRERSRGFWSDEEDDEFSLVEDGDDDFRDDEITSMAHAELELHREIREYARIAAWDMPSLIKFAKPFTLPPQTHILRFRYTTYLGEQHPAENKVVVELASKDLTPSVLSEAQRQTFLKLVGPRYNPDTDIVRISCEKFATRAQNKRYLGDLVNTLVKEVKEGDSFVDVPLDLRHHRPKQKLAFPKEWAMTEQRQKQLAARRADRLRQEHEREAIVDGNVVVVEAARTLPALNPALKTNAAQEREKVAVKVSAKGSKTPLRR